MPRPRLAALAALALGMSLLPLAGTSTATADEGTVTISGTAYEFNRVRTMLAGATVHVLEHPELTTTVAEDGTYALEVPDGATITPTSSRRATAPSTSRPSPPTDRTW